MTDLLALHGLTVRYGPVAAVDDVTLTVGTGSVVGLIGPNGAGKTSLIDAVTGFAPSVTGAVHFDGAAIEHLSPHARARLGLARTFQALNLFEDLTVQENLDVAADGPRWWHVPVDVVRPGRRTHGHDGRAALDRVGLADHHDHLPGQLSHGQRNLLGLARALAARPRLVLLDEPAAGLDPAETARLGDLLRDLAADGTSVFLVDHDMGLVLSVCDTVHVLDFGQVIASGPPADIRRDPAVITAYLGTDA